MNFTDFCAKEGVRLLRDDINYIRNKLYHVPKAQKKAVMLRYIALWHEGMAECIEPNKRENAGRRKANLFLLLEL